MQHLGNLTTSYYNKLEKPWINTTQKNWTTQKFRYDLPIVLVHKDLPIVLVHKAPSHSSSCKQQFNVCSDSIVLLIALLYRALSCYKY